MNANTNDCHICERKYPIEDIGDCESCGDVYCSTCSALCKVESVEHEVCNQCQSESCGVCGMEFCDLHSSGGGCTDCENSTCYVHPIFHCEICSYETAYCCGTNCHVCQIPVDAQCFLHCDSCGQNTCLRCNIDCGKCGAKGLCVCLHHPCEVA